MDDGGPISAYSFSVALLVLCGVVAGKAVPGSLCIEDGLDGLVFGGSTPNNLSLTIHGEASSP